MSPERVRVIESIRAAFKGVVLGDGIGLSQGDAIDNYSDEATCQTLRAQDEKEDWETISPQSLHACYAAPSYFDPEGMRFHLPAFLVADLREQLRIDPIFQVTQMTDYKWAKMALLSLAQRRAVRDYLLFVRNEPNYEFDRPAAEQALSTYWIAD